MTENEIGAEIFECAIEVHRELGPGLLETVYEVTLSYRKQIQPTPQKMASPLNPRPAADAAKKRFPINNKRRLLNRRIATKPTPDA